MAPLEPDFIKRFDHKAADIYRRYEKADNLEGGQEFHL